jgi:transcriptional regulator with XRE-family HTH domain
MEQVKSISDRLKEFAKTQRISIREFERKCGLGNSFVNHIGQSLGVDKLENILQAFPTLNKDWILYGTGEMILNEVAEDLEADFQSNFNKVCSLIQKKDEQIDRLLDLLEVQKEEVKKDSVKNAG